MAENTSLSDDRASDEQHRELADLREETVTLPVNVLAGILASADGYCTVCAGELAGQMKQVDPTHDWPKLVEQAG